MRQSRFLALLTLVAALSATGLTGCGATELQEDAEPEPSFTGGQVAREFRAETGKTLREAAGTDPAWEQFSFGLNPSRELVRLYGIFSVYVVEAGNDEAVTSLLANKATGEPLEADEQGIYWERDSLSGTWIAYKLYGDNVVLAWFSEAKEPAIDARWSRLDQILSGVSS